ncbi:MAG: hypothetical protein IJW05_12715 [Lentisphaeria bacterium]|nr:hypothetical protein [Lentisphaeria bacterium]
MALDLGQAKQVEQAVAAKNELQLAEQAQQEQDGKKAESHLQRAARILGAPEQPEQPQGKSGEQPKSPQQDQQDQQGQQPKQEQPQTGAQQPEQPKPPQQQPKQPVALPVQEGDIDPKQAGMILDQMARDEQDLRDALKEQFRKKNSRIPPVSKDW